MAQGVSVLVLEARDRIGGRAFTDTASASLGSRLLLAAFLERQSVDGLRAPERLRVLEPDRFPAPRLRRRAPHGRVPRPRAFARSRSAWSASSAGPARRGLDIPAEAAFTQADARRSLVSDGDGRPHRLGGRRAARTSPRSIPPVRRGRRRLRDPARLRHAARALREGRRRQLNTPVTRIRWGGRGVAADTAAGLVTARVAVVALPSAVVAEGAVMFTPHLPAEVLQAHHDLPLGILDKIALRFKSNVFPSEAHRVPADEARRRARARLT